MSQPWTPPPAPSSAPASTIPNNMVLAIIASVVSFMICCLPHGVLSLIFALQVSKKEAAGDIEGATKASKLAKMFAWISIIVSAVTVILWFVFGIFGVIMSAIGNR
jgi:Interferon-induced transmembrane protein